jgi:ribosomal protein S18 acetylase RimI-like enzyme
MADGTEVPAGGVRRLDRDLLGAHLAEVLGIEAAARHEMGDAYSHEAWGAEHFLAERPAKWALSFGAFLDDRLVGFLIASRHGDDAHLHRLAVHPEARGAAFARHLLAAVEGEARAHRLSRLTLSVASANARALRLFRAFGYRPLEGDAIRSYARARGVVPAGAEVEAAGHRYRILYKAIPGDAASP